MRLSHLFDEHTDEHSPAGRSYNSYYDPLLSRHNEQFFWGLWIQEVVGKFKLSPPHLLGAWSINATTTVEYGITSPKLYQMSSATILKLR